MAKSTWTPRTEDTELRACRTDVVDPLVKVEVLDAGLQEVWGATRTISRELAESRPDLYRIIEPAVGSDSTRWPWGTETIDAGD